MSFQKAMRPSPRMSNTDAKRMRGMDRGLLEFRIVSVVVAEYPGTAGFMDARVHKILWSLPASRHREGNGPVGPFWGEEGGLLPAPRKTNLLNISVHEDSWKPKLTGDGKTQVRPATGVRVAFVPMPLGARLTRAEGRGRGCLAGTVLLCTFATGPPFQVLKNGNTANISAHEDSWKPKLAAMVRHECPDPRGAKHLPEIDGSLQKRVRSKKKIVRLQKQEWVNILMTFLFLKLDLFISQEIPLKINFLNRAS